jgi:hypothetical protein
MPRSRSDRKLSRWEVLGAWTRVWTPPRDVEVPPIPWRAIGIGAFVVVVVAVLVVAVGIPAVQENNRDTESREQSAAQARTKARLRLLAAVQNAHHGAGEGARDVAGRRALVRELEAQILKDARARVRAKEVGLRDRIRRVDCRPGRRSGAGGVVPEDDPSRVRAGYDCTAVTSDISGHGNAVIGYPFKGVVDFRTGALIWCRTNPPPGEQIAADPTKVPTVPPECVDPGAS